jgi:hypothetical protein
LWGYAESIDTDLGEDKMDYEIKKLVIQRNDETEGYRILIVWETGTESYLQGDFRSVEKAEEEALLFADIDGGDILIEQQLEDDYED